MPYIESKSTDRIKPDTARFTFSSTWVFLAEILTFLFSPITATIVGVFVIFKEYVSRDNDLAYDWLIAALCVIVIAVVTLMIFIKAKIVSNFDVTDRTQRPRLLAVITVLFAGLLVATNKMGYTDALPILSFITLAFLIASTITLFWKVSFHTFAVTLTVLLIISTYHNPSLYMLLTIPLIVAWTRVMLHKHTFNQAIGGIMLAVGITLLWSLVPFLPSL